MDSNEVWARLGNDEDAQETIMAAHLNDGHLSRSAANELACGDWAFSTLQELGLVEPMRADGGLRLNARGKKVAAELEDDLADGHLRQQALEREVLKVARALRGGERVRTAEVLEQLAPAKYGQAWDEQEVEEAIDGLSQDGLVDSRETLAATLLQGITRQGRARLSPAGRSTSTASIFNDRSLTIAGDNLGNAATGDHVTQTSAVTVISLATGALELLLSHVDDLPEDVQEVVRDEIEAAHAELALANPDTSKAARWLSRASETLGAVAGSPKVANFLAALQLIAGVLLGAN